MKDFEGIDHGTNQIDLSVFSDFKPEQFLPIEIHHKADGSKTNEPSFCIVMVSGSRVVFGQVSLEMLNEGLADIGYKIIRK